MDVKDLLLLSPTELITEVKKNKSPRKISDFMNHFDPKAHDVMDKTKRPDKVVTVEEEGRKITKTVSVSRLSVPFQKIIVNRAASFLIGEGITLEYSADTDNEKKLIEMIGKTAYDNKINYKTRQLARIWMAETEVAELWYFDEKPELWTGMDLPDSVRLRMKMQVLANSLGDQMYPYIDDYADLKAFGHGYKSGKTEYFDLYTSERIIKYEKKLNWTLIEDKENPLKKIPVIYYSRQYPEWWDVQEMIDRFEKMISNFADQNDYFASPMIKVKGEVIGFASKGEQGKIITLQDDADADYLTWDQAPASIQLEKETLQEIIMSMTQTPDISFKQMQGMGNITGIALKMMFLDAKLKAMKHEEIFGEGIQRRINLIKAGMSIINTSIENALNLQIEPVFNFYLPSNDQELVNILATATGNKAILSRKTALKNNPFVVDAEKEQEDIIEDEAGQFGNIFDQT